MIKIEDADKSFESCQDCVHAYDSTEICILRRCIHAFSELIECYKPKKELKPPAQPEPLSDAYTKAVWTWLLDYQIKAAELKGRYTPYEVLSWVANDWRKEHERYYKPKSGD